MRSKEVSLLAVVVKGAGLSPEVKQQCDLIEFLISKKQDKLVGFYPHASGDAQYLFVKVSKTELRRYPITQRDGKPCVLKAYSIYQNNTFGPLQPTEETLPTFDIKNLFTPTEVVDARDRYSKVQVTNSFPELSGSSLSDLQQNHLYHTCLLQGGQSFADALKMAFDVITADATTAEEDAREKTKLLLALYTGDLQQLEDMQKSAVAHLSKFFSPLLINQFNKDILYPTNTYHPHVRDILNFYFHIIETHLKEINPSMALPVPMQIAERDVTVKLGNVTHRFIEEKVHDSRDRVGFADAISRAVARLIELQENSSEQIDKIIKYVLSGFEKNEDLCGRAKVALFHQINNLIEGGRLNLAVYAASNEYLTDLRTVYMKNRFILMRGELVKKVSIGQYLRITYELTAEQTAELEFIIKAYRNTPNTSPDADSDEEWLTHKTRILFELWGKLFMQTPCAQVINFLKQRIVSGRLIPEISDLSKLFSLPFDQFSEDERLQILRKLNPKFIPLLFKNFDGFHGFFSRYGDKLARDYHEETLKAYEAQISSGELIQFAYHLELLFSFSINQVTSADRVQILNALQPKISSLFEDVNSLIILFTLPLEKLTSNDRRQIISELAPRIAEGALIRSVGELEKLFSLPLDKLSNDHRGQIISALCSGISSGKFIQSLGELERLFFLPPDKLSRDHLTQIISALLKNFNGLFIFFSLPLEKFTENNRKKIINEVERSISSGELIQSFDELVKLFSLPLDKLSSEDRGQILNALLPRISLLPLIDRDCILGKIFSLPVDQPASHYPLKILDALLPRISSGELIQSVNELVRLFFLPLYTLSSDYRGRIISALYSRISSGKFIQSSHELERLLFLPPDKLSSDHLTQIISALHKNFNGLFMLFSLPLEKFTKNGRRQIINEVEQSISLGELIQSLDELVKLFSLPLDKLSSEDRGQILNALLPRISLLPLIDRGCFLGKIFSLSVDQLAGHYRVKILDALLPRIFSGELIQSANELVKLFSLPLDKLSSEDRIRILNALLPKISLGELIRSPSEFAGLFVFLTSKVSDDVRGPILNALLPRISSGELIQSTEELKTLFLFMFDNLRGEGRVRILNALLPRISSGELIQSLCELNGLFDFLSYRFSDDLRGPILNALLPRISSGKLIQSADELEKLLSMFYRGDERPKILDKLVERNKIYIKNMKTTDSPHILMNDFVCSPENNLGVMIKSYCCNDAVQTFHALLKKTLELQKSDDPLPAEKFSHTVLCIKEQAISLLASVAPGILHEEEVEFAQEILETHRDGASWHFFARKPDSAYNPDLKRHLNFWKQLPVHRI